MAEKKYKLVLIHWTDAISGVEWENEQDMKKWNNSEHVVNEVGWEIENTKDFFTICSQIFSDGTFGNKTRIPKSIVTTRKVIRCSQ